MLPNILIWPPQKKPQKNNPFPTLKKKARAKKNVNTHDKQQPKDLSWDQRAKEDNSS